MIVCSYDHGPCVCGVPGSCSPADRSLNAVTNRRLSVQMAKAEARMEKTAAKVAVGGGGSIPAALDASKPALVSLAHFFHRWLKFSALKRATRVAAGDERPVNIGPRRLRRVGWLGFFFSGGRR